MTEKELTLRQRLLDAVVQAWCTPRNATKEVDVELAEDILVNVERVANAEVARLQAEVGKLHDRRRDALKVQAEQCGEVLAEVKRQMGAEIEHLQAENDELRSMLCWTDGDEVILVRRHE